MAVAGYFQSFVDKACSLSDANQANVTRVRDAVAAVVRSKQPTWQVALQGSNWKHTNTPSSDVDYLVDCKDGAISKPARAQFSRDLAEALRQQLICDAETCVGRKAVQAVLTWPDGRVIHLEVIFSRSSDGETAAGPNPFHGRADLQRAVRALKLLAESRPSLRDMVHGYRYEAVVLLAAPPGDKPSDPTGFEAFKKVLDLLVDVPTAADLQKRSEPVLTVLLGVVNDGGGMLSQGELDCWRNYASNVLGLLKKYDVGS